MLASCNRVAPELSVEHNMCTRSFGPRLLQNSKRLTVYGGVELGKGRELLQVHTVCCCVRWDGELHSNYSCHGINHPSVPFYKAQQQTKGCTSCPPSTFLLLRGDACCLTWNSPGAGQTVSKGKGVSFGMGS